MTREEYQFPSIEGIQVPQWKYERGHVVRLLVVDTQNAEQFRVVPGGVEINARHSDGEWLKIFNSGYGAMESKNDGPDTPAMPNIFQAMEFALFLGATTAQEIRDGNVMQGTNRVRHWRPNPSWRPPGATEDINVGEIHDGEGVLNNPETFTPEGALGGGAAGSTAVTADIISEFSGFTTERPGALANANGEVLRCVITIPFKTTKETVPVLAFTGNFRVMMGDNRFINVSNPNVLVRTRNHAVVEFTLATAYPSNSPVHLVYSNASSRINVTP
jgi:hypothetical protein